MYLKVVLGRVVEVGWVVDRWPPSAKVRRSFADLRNSLMRSSV